MGALVSLVGECLLREVVVLMQCVRQTLSFDVDDVRNERRPVLRSMALLELIL